MRSLMALAVALSAAAQDPYVVAPENYKLEFENEWVRVSRVSYRPGDKLPVHDHPALPTIYVYLTNGGPIRFGHKEFRALERPAVKAWQIRFNRGNKETHTTEYLGDAPSEYLRVELKWDEVERPKRDVRIAADDMTLYENTQLLIRKLDCQPCDPVPGPSVLITLNDGKAQWTSTERGHGKQVRIELKSPPLP